MTPLDNGPYDEDVRAALRDASFFASGRFATSRVQPSYTPCYHVVGHASGYYLSGCGRLLSADTETSAVGIVHRCQRRGCRERWPETAAAGSKTDPGDTQDIPRTTLYPTD